MSEFIEVLNTAAAHGTTTTIAVSGALGLRRVVGPSLDAVGEALGRFSRYRAENILRIGEKAQRRLGDQPADEDEPTVHPRVAKEVLDEGSWIDDDLHQEYLAALLVGARTRGGTSDAEAYFARIVTGLTAEQVHLHYATMVAYEGYWDGQGECPFPFPTQFRYSQHGVLVETEEVQSIFPRFEAVAQGLQREGILETYGHLGELHERTSTHLGLVPTRLGFDLYMTAIGGGVLSPTVVLLSRERLNAVLPQSSASIQALSYPQPEPALFRTAEIGNVGS
jgi:hypothetical protein